MTNLPQMKISRIFLLVQQDETKQFIPKHILYHHSFERYMKQFLPAFSLEKSENMVC